MNKLLLDEDILQDLQKARQTYGNKNQILVCMEELNELACVLAKFPRYDNERVATLTLSANVLDEVADVMIILSHVKSIFNLTDEDVDERIKAKVGRLRRWLRHGDSMNETIIDRNV